mgnify:FL=1
MPLLIGEVARKAGEVYKFLEPMHYHVWALLLYGWVRF